MLLLFSEITLPYGLNIFHKDMTPLCRPTKLLIPAQRVKISNNRVFCSHLDNLILFSPD